MIVKHLVNVVYAILDFLRVYLRPLNDISGILAVLVAAFAAGAACLQLQNWKKEAKGTTNYRVALNYRRSLLQMEDAISDLWYSHTRPNEINDCSDEKHEDIPSQGSEEDWKEYYQRQGINNLENKLNRRQRVFRLRWGKMMERYIIFQQKLAEANVHSMCKVRSSEELDLFLHRVKGLFDLQFGNMQDEIENEKRALRQEPEERGQPPWRHAEYRRQQLQENGLLPPKGWIAGGNWDMDRDRIDEDLKALIKQLNSLVDQHMLH